MCGLALRCFAVAPDSPVCPLHGLRLPGGMDRPPRPAYPPPSAKSVCPGPFPPSAEAQLFEAEVEPFALDDPMEGAAPGTESDSEEDDPPMLEDLSRPGAPPVLWFGLGGLQPGGRCTLYSLRSLQSPVVDVDPLGSWVSACPNLAGGNIRGPFGGVCDTGKEEIKRFVVAILRNSAAWQFVAEKC